MKCPLLGGASERLHAGGGHGTIAERCGGAGDEDPGSDFESDERRRSRGGRRQIAAIEQDLTHRLIDRFQIELSCLYYDTTNFYTFIDSFNEASGLAQRGKSKEKRMDLRIVGLALLVTKDFHIPLFHQVYAGNIHDPTSFASVTEALMARYRLFSQNVDQITLVYDKGNNSQDNQQSLDAGTYHF